MFHWGLQSYYGAGPFPFTSALILPFVIWTFIWKGLVLWLTARRGQTGWFIFFLFVNTVGIGEIIYLLATNGFAELRKSSK